MRAEVDSQAKARAEGTKMVRSLSGAFCFATSADLRSSKALRREVRVAKDNLRCRCSRGSQILDSPA